MPVIGVGGGIASGKTTLCKLFEKWGGCIIDADTIGKDVVEKDPVLLNMLAETFGKDILHDNGTLNRRTLGHIVFQDQGARGKLNAIVHPALLSELTEKVRKELRDNPKAVVVIDAALLLEWDLQSLLDILIVVKTEEEKQLERLVQYLGFTHEEAQARIQAQSHFMEKTTTADFIITNNSTLHELEQKAKIVWNEILDIHNSKSQIQTRKKRMDHEKG